jgi:hypothetical protein
MSRKQLSVGNQIDPEVHGAYQWSQNEYSAVTGFIRQKNRIPESPAARKRAIRDTANLPFPPTALPVSGSWGLIRNPAETLRLLSLPQGTITV